MRKRLWRILPLVLVAGALACTAPTAPGGAVELGAREAQTLAGRTPDLLVVDVRTPEEFAAGHLEGAVNVDFKSPGFEAGLQALPKDRPVLLYCRTGNRSSKSLPVFAKLGFSTVYHLTGGITEWREAGMPLSPAPEPAPGGGPPPDPAP